MGSNHSKPCCGVFEREFRRASQEELQQLFRVQQAMGSLQDEIHVYCREDEVDEYLREIDRDPIVFHFKVENTPEIKDNSLEDREKLGAAEICATVLEVAEVVEPGGDVAEKLESGGDVEVRSEPKQGIVLGTGALPPELGRILTSLCQQVFHVLQVQKSSRDPSERTKGHAPVEDLPPYSLESQPSILSSGTHTRSPSLGVELQSSGDVRHVCEGAFLANAQKAPCRTDLELATGDMLRTGKEPTMGPLRLGDASSEETLVEKDDGAAKELMTGPMKLEHGSSEETLVDTDETLSDMGTTETADEHSDVKTDLEMEEMAEIPLSLSSDLSRAASKPLQILNEREGKVPEDDYDGENVGARFPERAQRGMSATVDSGDETERPIAVKVVRTRPSHWRSCSTLCKKTDVLVASDAEDLHSLPKDEAKSMTKENQRQKSVVQNVEARPLTGVAEITGAVSSPKALLETSETQQGGPLSSSAEPVAQVSRNAQLSQKSLTVSDPTMEDSAPGQRC